MACVTLGSGEAFLSGMMREGITARHRKNLASLRLLYTVSHGEL